MTERTGQSGEPSQTRTKPRRKKISGVVSIDPERCKGCSYCVAFCPLGVLAMSVKFNTKGYHYPEVVDGEKCTGCDLCGMYCPDFAIYGTRASGAAGGRSADSRSDTE